MPTARCPSGSAATGQQATLLAPTAMNQQRFRFTLLPDDTVRAESRGGSYSHVDLGIVKYHFQLGAGRELPLGGVSRRFRTRVC